MAENHKNNEKVGSDDVHVDSESSNLQIAIIDEIAENLDSVDSLKAEPLSFYDLPIEILGEIVGKLDLKDRLRTRKVSRILRSVADKQKAEYVEISISITLDQTSIYFDKNWVKYRKRSDGCLMTHRFPGQDYKHTTLNGNFLEIALNDLAIALKNPKLQLKFLEFSFEDIKELETEKLLKFFNSLNTRIHTKGVRITGYGDKTALSILTLIKPGTLEKIYLDHVNTELIANEIFKMKQWKQAKELYVGDPLSVGVKEFLHFNRVNTYVDAISTQDVILLRDALSKSPNFEYCHMTSSNTISNSTIAEIKRALGTVVPNGLFDTVSHRYPIPGSNESLEIQFNWLFVSVKRIH